MSTESDLLFVRNYFAGYESDPCSFDADVPANLHYDLQDCNCVLNCSHKFSPDARLLLRACYHRLTSAGQTKFLATHTPSTGKTQYRLPTVEHGLRKVCKTFFINTLQETRDVVREKLLDKRKSVMPEVDEQDENSEEILPDKRYKTELTEENGFKGFDLDIDCIKVEGFDTEQLILPDGPSAINRDNTEENGLEEKILPDLHEGSNLTNLPVKHEPVDIETDTNEQAAENHDFMIVLPRDDDSFDEELLLAQEADEDNANPGILSSNIQEGVSRRMLAVNFRRECKIRGLSYLNDCGKSIPARAVKPNCGATCHYQCRTRVSEEMRQKLLKNLLLLSQKNQWKFINDHICIMPPTAKPRSLSNRRSLTCWYFLPIESRLVKVCRTMFINTYDLSIKILRRIKAKKIGDKHVVCDNPNFPAVLMKEGSSRFYFDYDEGCDQAVSVAQQVRCKCDLECAKTFSDDMIAQIRSSFRGKSKKEQDDFLSKHVQLSPGKRERYKSALIRSRFFLPHGSTIKEVCRKTFLRTLMLNSSQLFNLLKRLPVNLDQPVEAEDSFEVAINEDAPRIDVVLCPNVPDVNDSDIKSLPDVDDASNSINELVQHDPIDIKTETNELEADDDDSADQDLLVNPEAEEDQDDTSGTDSQSEIVLSEEEGLSNHKLRQKKRRLRGLSYISQSGRPIPARTVKPSCGASCKFQCGTRISEEIRQQLLANLLRKSLADQRNFIADHICNMPATNTLTGRFFNHYFLPVDSRLVKVCKLMFVNTYDLTDKKIRIILAKKSGDKQAVCGNPKFPQLLKQRSKSYFDFGEGYDQAVCKCNMLCAKMFSEEIIEQIQNSFRNMTKKKQDKFFSKHIQLFNDKRNQNKNPLFRARFFLPRGSSDLEEVCRLMFMHAFKLNNHQVRILVENLPTRLDPLELAKQHIATYRMEEDHHCAVSGALIKLSHSPNVARMYSEYRAEGCRWQDSGVEPIDYRQYFEEFCRYFAKTGLLRPTSCSDCGYFDRGEGC